MKKLFITVAIATTCFGPAFNAKAEQFYSAHECAKRYIELFENNTSKIRKFGYDDSERHLALGQMYVFMKVQGASAIQRCSAKPNNVDCRRIKNTCAEAVHQIKTVIRTYSR